MLEALYNISLLAETGFLTYLGSKFALDYLWEQTVKFVTSSDLWGTPEMEAIMAQIMKEKI